ncbi:MAG TPA: Hpt domain-containing protein [Gemmatimonadaceae bacterium]
MSTSATVLDFFILEATEYVDRLDALIGAGGADGPDAQALQRPVRALRGSATMSRQPGIAELAGALERAVHARRDGRLAWTAGVRAAFVAAVDDLRHLLRRVRSWSGDDDRRVQRRVAELDTLAPDRSASPAATPVRPNGTYLVNTTAELAQALERYTDHPMDHAAFTLMMGRVRTLRGVAAIKDIPPTADVVDAVERVGKSLELASTPPSAQQIGVLSAAAAVLRRISNEVTGHGRPSVDSPEALRFTAALAALDETGVTNDADRIVPIAQLFYGDGGPHVVSAAANPPTRPADRFRLEVVSQAEHIHRLVFDARASTDIAGAERITRELRAALRALRALAESFGEEHVVRFTDTWNAHVSASHPAALAALESAASLLSNRVARRDDVVRELGRLTPGRPTPNAAVPAVEAPASRPVAASPAPASSTATAVPAPLPASPAAPATVLREPLRTPTGKDLRDFLENGIVTIEQLREQPLSQPVPLPHDEVVPIEQLLYRGRAALERAAALRDELRGAAPSPEVLDELFDLLDLALAD